MLLPQMKIHPSYISFVSFYYEFHYFLLFLFETIIGRVTNPENANLGIFWAFILNVNAPREGVYLVFCFPNIEKPLVFPNSKLKGIGGIIMVGGGGTPT